MSSPKPTRDQGDLAEMLDTVLDKGVVINADIAVSVGDTELLGIQLRAAVASFETAAEYGLAFPSGTDMERVHEAAGVEPSGASEPGIDDPESGERVGLDAGSVADAGAGDRDATPEDRRAAAASEAEGETETGTGVVEDQ
jgi:hypothetical protein